MDLVPKFTSHVRQYMSQSPEHVVVVHCKAGKGRTGTVVACWLLENGEEATADAALERFSRERTHNKQGVTIPSQIRCVSCRAKTSHAALGPRRGSNGTFAVVVFYLSFVKPDGQRVGSQTPRVRGSFFHMEGHGLGR